MKQVMIVAAEASSALFAGRLIEHLQSKRKDIQFFGVGSQAMEDLGFERLGKAEEMAVVGIAEVIEHYSHLKAVFNRLVEAAQTRKPDVVIVMDYPDFNLMLAKKLHALGIPVVYYITPQVWVWRKSRVKKIKKYCKKAFVLFPFEVDFFKDKNVPVEFVGHPVLDELDEKLFDENYRKSHRNRCGIQDQDIVIGLMPGSRRSELKHNLPTQLKVARRLYKKFPHIRILLMAAPTVNKETLKDQLEDVRFPIMLLQDDPFQMIHLTDYVLAASGTATLMVGLMKKPMVIMYKAKWMTWLLSKILVPGLKIVGLPNLILGKREVVPERIQFRANEEELVRLMSRYIEDSAHSQAIGQELSQIHKYLGDKGATARVAAGLKEFIGEPV